MECVNAVALNVEHAADLLRSGSTGNLLSPHVSVAGKAGESDALRSELLDRCRRGHIVAVPCVDCVLSVSVNHSE